MKKYFAYSTAILLGGLVLGLGGCGSSNGSSCSSGQTMTTAGCGTGSCTVPGTNQAGALVNNSCAALSGATTSATCQSGYTLQAMPAPYNSSPALAASGGQACCPPGLNVSQSPQFVSYCQAPITNGYGTTGYGTTGSNYCQSLGPYYVPNGMGGCTYE